MGMGESHQNQIGTRYFTAFKQTKVFFPHTHTNIHKTLHSFRDKNFILKRIKGELFHFGTFDKIYADLVLFATTVASQNVLAWLQRIDLA